MAQKLNTRNWKLGKFREKAREQIIQTGEKEEVLMEKHMEDCYPGQSGFRKARRCVINSIQFPVRAAMFPPFSL